MAMLEFIKGAPKRDIVTIGGLTLLAGIANATLVVAVNEVTKVIAVGERVGLFAVGSFIAAFLIYYVGNKIALLRANNVIESLLNRLRLNVLDKIRCSELQTVDRLGRGSLYSLVSQETNHLSVAFPLVVDGFQQAILLGVSLIYLAYLSPAALIAFVSAVLLAFFGFRILARDFRRVMGLIQNRQAQMLDAIEDIINGGKELRLNRQKSDDVFQQYRKISRSAESLMVISGENWTSLLLLGNTAIFGMLGIVAFAFPGEVSGFDKIVFQVVPVLLFCVGPLSRIVGQMPMILRADIGLQSILKIEGELAEAGSISTEEARKSAVYYKDFEKISYTDLGFSYSDKNNEPLFTAGPFNLTLHRGETVFLVGGNGSGKSTVLRMITGLFASDTGRILVDEVPVVGRAIAGYRELFSSIFVDFHLFDRLYGLEDIDPTHVNRMIEEMGLGGKVQYDDGRFTQLALSTAQRKRLALIAALLEDKSVYVFDEWSAEQDVRFREYFYTRILPDLKERGKTVIAVTHDERYWHLAERVVKIDFGRVVWDRRGTDLEPQ